RAGEETYLNALLERHDVPLYYDADAVVDHNVEPRRLVRAQLRRKAYWAGLSDAYLSRLLGEVKGGTWRSAGSAVREAIGARSSGLLTPSLRAAHAIGAARGSRGGSMTPRQPLWSLDDWLSEVQRWPQGAARLHEEANTLVALGRANEAQEALAA